MKFVAKLAVIISSLLLIAMTLLAAATPFPAGYFVPFWSAFPTPLWIFFGLVVLLSLGVLLESAATGSPAWRYATVILASAYLVYFALPQILGLRFWAPPRTDMHSHLGNTAHIIETGGVHPGNTYPTLHIYLAEVSYITGIELEPLVLFTWFHTVLFIAGIALFVRELFGTRRAAICALAVAFPLVYGGRHHAWMPWFVSFTLIPLALFMVERYRRSRTRKQLIATLIVLLAFVFYHPMTSGLLFGIVATFICVGIGYRSLPTTSFDPERGYSPLVALIVFVPYMVWTVNLDGVQNHLSRILVGLFYVEESQGVITEAERAEGSGYTLGQLFVDFVVGQYGHFLVYLVLGGLVAFYIVYRVLRGDYSLEPALLSGLFFSGIALAVAGLVFDLVAAEPVRINQLSVLAAILLLSFALMRLFDIRDERSLRARHVCVLGLVAGAIVIAALLGPVQFYNQNQHVVDSEYAGTDHALTYQDFSIPTIASNTPHRHAVYQLGRGEASAIPWDQRPFQGYRPPSHLGYDRNPTVAATFEEPLYLHTHERDLNWWKLEPENRYQYIDFYTEDDLDVLRDDPTAHNVYSNGNYEIWRVMAE